MPKSHNILVVFIRWVALCVTVVGFSMAAHAEKIVLVNDVTPYCPYTICEQGKRGFVIDIVQAVFEGQGYTVVVLDVPWNRAMAMIKDGSANGILNITRKSGQGLIFPNSEVARVNPSIFVLKRNPWNYNGTASLKNVRLGLIRNYGYGENNPPLEKYLNSDPEKVIWFSGIDPLTEILRQIEGGLLDATIEDQTVGNYVLQKAGLQDQFRVAGHPEQGTISLYVAFTTKKPNSRQLAEVFDSGLLKLRKSGKMKAILAKYGMTDWNE